MAREAVAVKRINEGRPIKRSVWQRLTASRTGRTALGITTALSLASCATEATEAAAPAQETQTFGAVYYQPRISDLYDPQSQTVPSTVYTMLAEAGQSLSWTSAERCNPTNADNFLETNAGVTTLGGFSLGRLGLAYFLQTAPADKQAGVNYMLSIAPGNSEDFTDSCDPENTAGLVQNWLAQAPDHYFTVIADQRTAEQDYAGIRELYLDRVKGTEQADQMTVCASGLGHEATFNSFKTLLDDQQPTVDPRACPPDTTAYAW